MSIVRFSLDTFSLPVYIPEISPSQSDPNQMIQTVTLEYYDGSNYFSSGAVHLSWVNVDQTKPTPIPPSQTSNGFQAETPYYFCYDFEHVLTLVNTALTTAFNAIIVLNPAKLASQQAPFLAWDENRNCAILYAREDGYDSTESISTKIYFNRSLYALFNSFPVIKYGITNPENKQYQIVVNPFNGAKVVPGNSDVFGTHQLIRVPQYTSTIANWSPVSSIVFTSNTLPIIPNQLSSPLVYQNGNLIQLSTTANSLVI
jgi:Sputnik minor capsid protein V18/19